MYIRLFVVLTISWLAHGSISYAADDFDSTSNNLLLHELTKSCPSDGIPVCGIRNNKQFVIFPNECLLEEVNKNSYLDRTNIKKISLKQCIYGCQLNCPKIYKPICAKNVKTHEKKIYFNLCEATKYACKTNMDFIQLKLHECESRMVFNHTNKLIEKRSKYLKRKPIPCTNIFKPVCASYMGVKSTFKNECILNSENIKYNRDWRIVKRGICAEDYSNVPELKYIPSKPHSIRKRSYTNNNFGTYPAGNKYDSDTYGDYKSESHVPHNDVYVYMPTPFQTQFLDHSFQPMKVESAYNDILKSIISMPTEEEDEKKIPDYKNVAHGYTPSEPIPFTANRLNFNYIPKKNFIDRISAPEPSASNNFRNTNKNYFYTFEKVQPNAETLNMAHDKLRPETKQLASQKSTLSSEIEERTFGNKETTQKTEQIIEMTTVTEIPISPGELENNKKFEILNDEQILECKFGSLPICGVLPDGTVKTFDSVCDMMTTNIYLQNTWTKLHEGDCGSCKYNCTKHYQPICVTRNSVNYTLVNDCFFNMGICMDKKSIWKKIANGECERYTRIPDKYESLKSGFPYTSSNFISSNPTTMINAIASATPLPTTIGIVNTNDITVGSNKPLRLKSRKSNVPKPSSKRVVNRRSSASKKSSNKNVLSKRNVIVATDRPTTRLSIYGPHSYSYIMRLVNERVNRKLHLST